MSLERPRGGLYQYQSIVPTFVNPGAALGTGEYPDSWHPDATRVVRRLLLAIPTGATVFETPAPPVVGSFDWFVATGTPQFRRKQLTRAYVYEPIQFAEPTTGWFLLPAVVVYPERRPITPGARIDEPSVFTTQEHGWLAQLPGPVRNDYRLPLSGTNLFVPPILPPFEWYVPIVQPFPRRKTKARESYIYEPVTPATVFTGWMSLPAVPVYHDRRPPTFGAYTREPTGFVIPETGWFSQHPIRPARDSRPVTTGAYTFEPTLAFTPTMGWYSVTRPPVRPMYRQPWPGTQLLEPTLAITPISSWMTMLPDPVVRERRPVTIGAVLLEQLLTQPPVLGWLTMPVPRPSADRRPVTVGDWRYEPTLFETPQTGWLFMPAGVVRKDQRPLTVGALLYEPTILETPQTGWMGLAQIPGIPLRPPHTFGVYVVDPSNLVELTPMGWLQMAVDVGRREHRILIPGAHLIEPTTVMTPESGWMFLPADVVRRLETMVHLSGIATPVFRTRPFDYRRWRSG